MPQLIDVFWSAQVQHCIGTAVLMAVAIFGACLADLLIDLLPGSKAIKRLLRTTAWLVALTDCIVLVTFAAGVQLSTPLHSVQKQASSLCGTRCTGAYAEKSSPGNALPPSAQRSGSEQTRYEDNPAITV